MRARHGVGHGVEPNRQVQIGAVLATQYRQATDPRSSPTSALFPAAIRPGIASATESPSPLQRQAHHQIKFRRIAADSRRHRQSRLHWQPFGGSFQGLDTGHLVDRNGLTALFGHGGRRLVHRANVSTFLTVEAGIGLRCQPVTDAMRFKGPASFLKKSARPNRARYFRRCHVGPPGEPVRSGSND